MRQTVVSKLKMGNSGGKKRTQTSEDGSSPALMDKDQYRDSYGESYRDDGNNPIKEKRSCTDVICLLLFIAFLGGWGVVAFFGIQGGDIDKVIYPTNSQVRLPNTFKGKDKILFFLRARCVDGESRRTGPTC